MASRAGRVSVPPRRLEHDIADAAAAQLTRSTVTTRKDALEKGKTTASASNGASDVLRAIQELDVNTRAELAAIRNEQKDSRSEQKEVHARLATRLDVVERRLEGFILAVGEQLEAITNRLNQVGKDATTATTTYADALKIGLPVSGATTTPATTTTQGTPVTQVCSINPSSSASQPNATSSPHVIVDISAAERRESLSAEKPGQVRRRIEEALQEQEHTKEVRCEGISRSARDNNKFKIYFTDDKAVQTVREHDGWLQGYLQGTRLQAEQWYPIRVDSVYKGAVLTSMDSTEVKEGAGPMVAEENEVQVHKIQWLSKPDGNKIHGSMVLYLGRRQDAEKLLRRGRVEVDGETAFVRPYERRSGPLRCFKCHQFGHVKARCPSIDPVCSRCAEHGHTHRECTSQRIRCAGCGAMHSTFDTNCRMYRAACEKHQPASS